MALKLRPIGLGSGIDKDRPDYTVFTGEWEVGRIYETRGGPDSLRWFWSMTVNGPMTRSGRVATFDEAKAKFRRASQKIATCAMRWMTLAAKKKARWSCAPPGIARPSIDLRGVQAQSPNIHSHKQPMVNGIKAPTYTIRPK